jgi:hypothetical protein
LRNKNDFIFPSKFLIIKYNNLMRLKYGICILFFLSISLAKAQGAVEYLCRIIDMDDKYPVAFATIQFENKGNGVMYYTDIG